MQAADHSAVIMKQSAPRAIIPRYELLPGPRDESNRLPLADNTHLAHLGICWRAQDLVIAGVMRKAV